MIVHAAKPPLVNGQPTTIRLQQKAESRRLVAAASTIKHCRAGRRGTATILPLRCQIAYMKKHIFSLIVAAVAFGMVGGTASQAIAQDQPLGLPDIKMLAKNGVSEDVILSQIRNSHTVYHLSAAEIIDLKDAGVGQRAIDFMINTPSANPGGPVIASPPVAAPNSGTAMTPPPAMATMVAEAGSPPPPPIIEAVLASPGPQYVWVAGHWRWYSRSWVWAPGAWILPPRRGVEWVEGRWGRRFGRTVWVEGHWR